MQIPVFSSSVGGDGPKILDSESRNLAHRDQDNAQNLKDSGSPQSRQSTSLPISFGNNVNQNVIPKNHIPTQLMSEPGKGCGSAKAEPENQLLEKILTALRQLMGSNQKSNPEEPNTNAASQDSHHLQPQSTSSTSSPVAPARVAPPTVESEKNTSYKPTEASGRPEGDHRSAEDIIRANPILAKLGDQKDINRQGAYKQVGDWTDTNKDPEARADAAYNAAKVLNYIDSSETAKGKDRGGVANNGDLEGLTSKGEARPGTPVASWKDFTERGYATLNDDHKLNATKDPQVRDNGTTYNNIDFT
jgi:hypothetical protein